MKTYIVLFLLLLPSIVLSQECCDCCDTCDSTEVYYHLYGDTNYMKLHSNKKIYILKNDIPDGKYVIFYDKEMKDTAVIGCIKDGYINGEYCYWHPNRNYLEMKANYKDSKLNGKRYLYFWADSNRYTNIELFKDGKLSKIIQMEW
jgi:hypothetical protein